MPQGTRELKRRIRSVKNTRQITKAMEAVAVSKMRKAQHAALDARAYALKALELLSHVQEKVGRASHPLLASRPAKRVTVIVFTTDKGLCGALNTNVLKKAIEALDAESGTQTTLVTVGKKGAAFFKKTRADITATFSSLGDRTDIGDVAAISRVALDDFLNHRTDKVILVYANFVSTLRQVPQIRQLLPLSRQLITEISELSSLELREEDTRAKSFDFDYLLEPNADMLLSALLPKLVEMQIYRALLEANASEHSARMIAMKNATDNASDILEDLNLTYNQLRQSTITKEISEIVGGVEALKDQE